MRIVSLREEHPPAPLHKGEVGEKQNASAFEAKRLSVLIETSFRFALLIVGSKKLSLQLIEVNQEKEVN